MAVLKQTMLTITERMGGHKILVVGDMVADVYLEGRIARISREAPVLVLEHAGETVVPGGAANAVHNAATLGGAVYAVGVVGNDAAGRKLIELLQAKGVNTQAMVVDPGRPTITKTRVMAGGLATVRQQIVRIDREDRTPLGPSVRSALLEQVRNEIEGAAAVVLSDYGSGTLSPELTRLILTTCSARNIPCIVDSRYDILAFTGATVIKQNEAETATALGFASLDGRLMEAGAAMLAKLKAKAVLITRGPEGMSLFEDGGQVTHIPVSNVSEVFDVSGAGDTVVVTVALALAAGAPLCEAARLANFAAGVVVRKPGTATASLQELREAVETDEETIQ